MEGEEKAGSGHVDKTRTGTGSAHGLRGQKRCPAADTRGVRGTVPPASPSPPGIAVPDSRGALGRESHSEPQSNVPELPTGVGEGLRPQRGS